MARKSVWETVRSLNMAKEAERVKNSERAPYTESELKELSKEELQGLYLGFYGKESGRLRESGLIKAILEFESKITEKETLRMARKTTEQAISEVRAATSEAEVKAILESLTKAQIFEVGFGILKFESPYAHMTDKKAKIVEYFAFAIMSEQMIERIMSQTLEEKAKSLLEVHFLVMRNVVESLGVYEQIALLSKYGISYEEFKREGEGYRLKTNLQYTLIEKIYKHKDELMEHLNKQSRTETNDTANPEKETVIMVKTNEVTTAKTKTLSELQDRVEVLKGRYELYCLQVKTSKYHLQDVLSKENRTCYEVMQARDEYKSARYERFQTYVEYRKMLSELRAATEIRKQTITMTKKQNEAIEELTEEYVSDEEKKFSEICQKANEIEECVTVERCQESKEKYDEAESALNALERVKEELSA